MIKIIKSWKAPTIRFFLVMGAFLVFIPRSSSQFNYDENCQQAYEAILSLKFTDAIKHLAAERNSDPGNLLPVYLENYIDFLTLIIGEEKVEYDQLKDKRGERVRTLENGGKDSPFYNFCLGEVHLQWGLIRLKFGDYTAAAFEIHKANSLFLANAARYPSFLINKTGMGVIHAMVSLVPENYKWVSNMFGLDGSLELGLNEIREVAEYSGPDVITRMYRPQASFFLAFLTLNLQKNKKDAIPILDLLKNNVSGHHQFNSPLLIYARASILMKNGLNEQALAVLKERKSLSSTFHFYYLDYLEGMTRLNKLDDSAATCFKRYIACFKGRNYIRSACQKLSWLAILRGDSNEYYRMNQRVLAEGSSAVDEDKQAEYEAGYGIRPNIVLLRSRLLFDGGYYNLAINELLNNSVKIVIKSKRDLLEYTYRLGRIYHETGNGNKAIQNYERTIILGKSEPYYFAAGASYQMGLIYENKAEFDKAESAYHLCLSLKPQEYKTSLHQKAKAGLNRIKNKG
jgi:tetratricopeptide (TPR) repeat protein